MKKGTELKIGARFIFDDQDKIGDANRVYLPHPEIFDAILPGHRMLVDDGNLQFKVTGVEDGKIITKVEAGGIISDRKGVNVPDVTLDISPLYGKRSVRIWNSRSGSAWIGWHCLSCRNSAMSWEARSIIKSRAALMVKIEKPAALLILEDIIRACDGIMVARGDLGVEMPPEQVPGTQRDITYACRRIGKPVVVATQMLESMITHHTPTRAEASDVATAVVHGVDCVMLSAETATGNYAAEAVAMMRRIIETTEARKGYAGALALKPVDAHTTYHAVAASATQLADAIGAVCVVGFSTTGATVVRLSRERPQLPIFMITPSQISRQRLGFTWGINSILSPYFDSFDEALAEITKLLLDNTDANSGDLVVVVAGTPFGVAGTTNTVRVLTLL